MAGVVAVELIEIIVEATAETTEALTDGSLVIEGADSAALAEELETEQAAIKLEAQNAFQEAINAEESVDTASSDAIDASYNKIAQINEDLADEWRFKVEEK